MPRVNVSKIEPTNKKQSHSDKQIDQTKPRIFNEVENMNRKELKTYRSHILSEMDKINNRQNKLDDEEFNCIVCCSRKKNIVFGGCHHFVICDLCERRMEIKKCSRCNHEYSQIYKVNL